MHNYFASNSIVHVKMGQTETAHKIAHAIPTAGVPVKRSPESAILSVHAIPTVCVHVKRKLEPAILSAHAIPTATVCVHVRRQLEPAILNANAIQTVKNNQIAAQLLAALTMIVAVRQDAIQVLIMTAVTYVAMVIKIAQNSAMMATFT